MKNKRIKRFDLSHSKPRLREHVQQLYSTCQLMDFDKIISPELFVIKKIKTKEEEILDMLTKIEIVFVLKINFHFIIIQMEYIMILIKKLCL